MLKISLIIACIAAFAYISLNVFLYLFQRHLIYFPAEELAGPQNYGLHNTSEIKLHTADGLNITAWYTPPAHNNPVVIYLHGNAGNLGDRTEKIAAFIATGMGHLAVSWRGYGTSYGTPSEEGFYNDGRAAIAFLREQGFGPGDIILYGESLGTGVATQLATEYKVRALVLEAPYTSIADRAAELYPYAPVRILLKDHFDSISKIGKVQSPVLIFHGYRDTVMPIHHARKVLSAANEPKEARFFEHVGHTDFNFPEIALYTYEFSRKYAE